MADANRGVAAKSGTSPVSAGGHGHNHEHGHAHSHEPAAPARREPSDALPRSYERSMFLASAIERLVIAVLLVGLIWLGIFWAVS
ncbi:MAG: hypothetical protein P0Y66_00365 [Candidatus Kaistia colombiensis]|nr:MAG: hypothetical protein P0Y66_00365 [Kaistia sp.]